MAQSALYGTMFLRITTSVSLLCITQFVKNMFVKCTYLDKQTVLQWSLAGCPMRVIAGADWCIKYSCLVSI